MQFFADGLSDGGDIGIYAKQISAYCDLLWERLRMDYITKEGLKQAAITGDYVQYFYWDSDLSTGQAVTGRHRHAADRQRQATTPATPTRPTCRASPTSFSLCAR